MQPDLPHNGTGPIGPEIRVSYHAVTRYVQRILHVTVASEFRDEKDRARQHCREAGTTLNKVRQAIWTPGIAMAADMGVSQVSNGVFGVVIDPLTGVITTVLEPRGKHRSRTDRLKLLSEREFRSRSRRYHRNQRHIPRLGTTATDADEENQHV